MKRLLLLGALTACHGGTSSGMDTPDARESPQASAQPAQLAALPPRIGVAPPAAEGVPLPLRGDEALSPDLGAREGAGYTLTAVLRPADIAGPARANEVNGFGIELARRATELRFAIDLSPTRLRIGLAGRGFVLPEDAEIRARSDRYGHVFVWPDGASYHPLAPGALRALLGERRFDVAPITPASIDLRPDVGMRIGIRTRRAEVATRAAKAVFEIGKLEGAGEGGVLLCRFLLDLMSAPPGDPVCAGDELPVRAELRWTRHGSMLFELTASMKRADLPLSALVVPPQNASYAAAPPTTSGLTPLLSHPELTGIRQNDIDVGPSVAGDTLTLVNTSPELRVFWLDGIAVAWLAPGGRGELHGLRRGRYVAQWRTFLGDTVEPPTTQTVPGLSPPGALDAGK